MQQDYELDLDRLAKEGRLRPTAPVTTSVEAFTPLLDAGPLDAEVAGSRYIGLLDVHPGDVPYALSDELTAAEATGTPEALALARVLAVLAPSSVRDQARDAADRLVAAGLTDPKWAHAIAKPQVGQCYGYFDLRTGRQHLAMTFAYGRKSHVVVVLIDYARGGGVRHCYVSDRPKNVHFAFTHLADDHDVPFRLYSPGQARNIVADALAHDPCPVDQDEAEDVRLTLALLRRRLDLLPPDPPTAADTSVHRLKVTLHGSKPPIWRRLEVPSTMPLLRLHDTLQRAFAWEDYHLWVFETSIGNFGLPDPELDHGDASSVTLADVATGPKGRIGYLYDFGDTWDHDIVVEAVTTAEPGTAYPRCLTGRRAGPPEDSGGIGGYEHLCEVLADPEHPEHATVLEWLNPDFVATFDPADFDLDAVNEDLAELATVLIKE